MREGDRFPLGRLKHRSRNVFGAVCDWLVKAGALALIVLTPLAFGSVHPWAFSLIEEAVALLGILFALRLLFDPTTARLPFSSLRQLSLPFVLFPFLVIAQLIPLPPSWLQTLSPSTYQLYAKSLVGWPATAPSADLD